MRIEDFHFFTAGSLEGAGAAGVSDAPWMIFLHGLLGSSANWRKITARFEADYRILAFDQRGHGRSFHPARGYSPEDFAGDLKFLMEHFKIDEAVLVGHSMGGRNALCFSSLYPQKVSRLVIEDIGPEASVENGTELVKKLKSVPVPFPDKRAAKEFLLKRFSDRRFADFLYTNVKADENGRGIWAFDLHSISEIIEKGRGTSRWSELESLRCPVLVVRGELSDQLPRDEFERMKACNPRVRGVEIAGAGHWVHFEKSEQFVGAVKNFLEP